ncbi:MAG: ABC-type dipeptide/oligopeptide/nickel transport system, permease component [Acetothermia bacterium 64_32]|nr:MAG: ABC-type dipeptide/oligopeptide/nickel transport system, permease component [Acetothermia bacterium 64_32]HAF70264.1 peptide permease [Candidatus Acetothermia bacterium]
MLNYVIRRLLLAVVVLIIVTIGIFMLIEISPGDPVAMMLTGQEMLLVTASKQQEFIEAQRERLGLNVPAPIRYVKWLAGVSKGQLGFSMIYSEPVTKMIGERVGPTLLLMGIALFISAVFGVLIGIISGVWQYSVVDYVSTLFSFAGISVPSFFLALIIIYLFALRLHWFPAAGMYTIGGPGGLSDLLWHACLPSTVLAWDNMANLVRYTRSAILETIKAEYVTAARAKGLSEKRVILLHVLRNALIPVVTIIGLRIPYFFGGAVIIETVFAWPGLGRLLVEAVYSKDYPVILGLNLIIALAVLLTNLLVDLSYAFIDPRIKYG